MIDGSWRRPETADAAGMKVDTWADAFGRWHVRVACYAGTDGVIDVAWNAVAGQIIEREESPTRSAADIAATVGVVLWLVPYCEAPYLDGDGGRPLTFWYREHDEVTEELDGYITHAQAKALVQGLSHAHVAAAAFIKTGAMPPDSVADDNELFHALRKARGDYDTRAWAGLYAYMKARVVLGATDSVRGW